MSGLLVTQILLGLLAVSIPVVAFFTASRATRMQSKAAQAAVDAGAYSRAKEIYDSAQDTLRGEVEPMRAEIQRLRESNMALQTELLRCQVDLARLQAEITRLREQLAEMHPPHGPPAGPQ